MARSHAKYVVHLFVIGRLSTEPIDADSARTAVRTARQWFRENRKSISSGELELDDEISHYQVDVEGDAARRHSESFEPEEHPLLAPLKKLVIWSAGRRDDLSLAQIVNEARGIFANSV